MRQLAISRLGGPEVLSLREAPDPDPGPGQVRVRVKAAGVNFADILMRMGLASAIMMLGLLISVASFFPLSRVARWVSGSLPGPSAHDDLYFYGHLARYDPERLVRGIEQWYLDVPDEEIMITRGKHDLAEQVILSAQMTSVKLRLFNISLLLVVIGAVVALIAALIALID